MGPFSPLEALRAVFGIIAILVHVYALSRAHEGRGAFALPIRDVMLRRRKISITISASICLVWVAQAFDAGSVFGTWPPTPQSINLSLAVMYTVTALGVIAWHQLSGWASFERLVGIRPLYPSGVDKAGYVASIETRPILHDAQDITMMVIGELDLATSPEQLWSIRRDLMERMHRLGELQSQAQTLVQSLSKPMPGDEGGMSHG